jgi:hypothetical protein
MSDSSSSGGGGSEKRTVTRPSSDLFYSVSMLARDLGATAAALAAQITSEESSEDTVVHRAKEAESRTEVLVVTAKRLCGEWPAAAVVLPPLVRKAQKRLRRLVEAVQHAYYNPYDLLAS